MNYKTKINFNTIIERNLENKFHLTNMSNIRNKPGKLFLFINDKKMKKIKDLRNNNLLNTKWILKNREKNDLNKTNSKFAKKLKNIKFINKNISLNDKENKYINLKNNKIKYNKNIRIQKLSCIKKKNKILNKNIKNIKKEINNNEFNKFYKKTKEYKTNLMKFRKDKKGNIFYLNIIKCYNGQFKLNKSH